MSHLPDYFEHLINDRGLTQNQAADRLALVQNGFASAAQRKWYFANLGSGGKLSADKGGKFGGAGKSKGVPSGGAPPSPTGALKDQNGVMRVQMYDKFTNVSDLTGKGLPNEAARAALSRAKKGDRFEYVSHEVDTKGGYAVVGVVRDVQKTKSGEVEVTVDRTNGDKKLTKINSKTKTKRVTLN